ncbi:hypothetical protein SOVF_096830 [Spinacia oleracea]|nr:hypothetical protein SOVF_096830 [Spinacia oleracea]
MAMSSWKQKEFAFIIIYAICFYIFIIYRSLKLSHDHYQQLRGLRPGWLANRLNDVSDGQWRNFRGNIPILSAVFGAFTALATSLRKFYHLRASGMSIVWLLISLIYLIYLHGACILFILSIASLNFLLVKIFARTKYFPYVLWTFNVFFLIFNRVYEGYSFSILGHQWAYLDSFRGTFRWHICFNFGSVTALSFSCYPTHDKFWI